MAQMERHRFTPIFYLLVFSETDKARVRGREAQGAAQLGMAHGGGNENNASVVCSDVFHEFGHSMIVADLPEKGHPVYFKNATTYASLDF